MSALGNLLKVVGFIVFVVAGLWGLFLCLGIVSKVAGFWGILVALLLTPFTLVATPLYAGFTWGDWFPFTLNYGGAIVSGTLIAIGSAMNGD